MATSRIRNTLKPNKINKLAQAKRLLENTELMINSAELDVSETAIHPNGYDLSTITEQLVEAEAAYPESPRPHILFAILHERIGNHELASELHRRRYKMPGYWAEYLDIVKGLLAKKHFEAAKDRLLYMLNLINTDDVAQHAPLTQEQTIKFNLFFAYAHLGLQNFGSACYFAQTALAHDKGNMEAMLIVRECYDPHPAEVEATPQEENDKMPGDWAIYLQDVEELLAKKQYHGAKNRLVRMVNMINDNEVAQHAPLSQEETTKLNLCFANAHFGLEEFKTACHFAATAVANDRDSLEAHLVFSKCERAHQAVLRSRFDLKYNHNYFLMWHAKELPANKHETTNSAPLSPQHDTLNKKIV